LGILGEFHPLPVGIGGFLPGLVLRGRLVRFHSARRHWPLVARSLQAGIRATSAGDLDRAQRNLETAFAYVPDNADINFALGNLWLERSNRSKNDAAVSATERDGRRFSTVARSISSRTMRGL